MKPGTRRVFAMLALLVLVLALGTLVVLRAGRPIWYGDDDAANHAIALRNASMSVWSAPEPSTELPAGLRGRIAKLPDGRVVCARTRSDPPGSSLVIWDPERPTLEPELAPSLGESLRGRISTELAPAFGSDGRLYFASDRSGGAGGFDLWTARWDGRAFDDVRRLPDGINSDFDESDPAPHPDGVQIVFLRRDPSIARGRHGELYVASLSQTEPTADSLFEDPGNDGPQPRFFDRDCIFDAAGSALWFVRRFENGSRKLLRTWSHPANSGVSGFVPPLPVAGLSALGSMRGPLVDASGRGLTLVDTRSGLLYRSTAREVRPWWAGQRDLEILLATLAACAALIFVMIWLGGRWTALDIVTQCILISMLVHLLLLLWLMRVQIVRTFIPPVPEIGDSVEVRLLDDSELDGGRSPDAAPTQEDFDISQQQRFEGFERELTAETPSASLADTDLRAAELPERARDAFVSADPAVTVAESVRPALPTVEVRRGTDRSVEPRAAKTSTSKLIAVAESTPDRRVESAEVERVAPGGPRALPRDLEARSQPIVARKLTTTAPRIEAAAEVDPSVAAAVDLPAPKAAEDVVGAAPSAARTGQTRRAIVPEVARTEEPLARALQSRANLARAVTSLPRPRTQGAGPRPSEREDDVRSAREMSAALATMRDTAAARRVREERDEKSAAQSIAAVRAGLEPDARQALPSARAAVTTETDRVARSSGKIERPATTVPRTRATRRAPSTKRVDKGLAAASRRFDEEIEVSTPVVAVVKRPSSTVESARNKSVDRKATTTAPVREATPSRPERVARARSDVNIGAEVTPPRFGLARKRRARAASIPRRVTARSGTLRASRPAIRDAVRSTVDATRTAAKGRAERSGSSPSRVETSIAALPGVAVFGGTRKPVWSVPPGSVSIPDTRVDRARRRARVIESKTPKKAQPTLYANRFGEKKVEALEKFGGSKETELAVQKGLRYLARIQRVDGGWGRQQDWDDKYGEVRIGKTALCLLAFLGAGNLPPILARPGEGAPDRIGKGEYATNVARAIDFLLAKQDEDTGHFGVSSAYGHGITTYALAECYALTQMKKLEAPLERAIDWILENQNGGGPRHSLGGWGYFSPRLRAEDRYARASVTSWQVMALESARRSGLDVPDRSLALAKRFLLQLFDARNGYFLYTKAPSRLQMDWRTLPASTPASIFCLLLLGHDANDERLRAGLEYTTDRRIRRYARASDDAFVLRGEGNPYLWYYGTLACFFRGGEAWEKWNATLRTQLPRGQSPDGSFAPVGAYASYAKDTRRDRAFTTAMCVLSLEVYYRYFTPLLEKRRSKIR